MVYFAIYGVGLLWLLALLPAMVACVVKRQWAMLFAGFLTFGVVWFIGAAAGESRRRLALAAAALLALAVVLGAFGARPAPVLGMDGASLESSVARGLEWRPCKHRPDGTWTCVRQELEQSGGTVAYRVDVDGL
ncbi:MAG TPA: hypothetical protein VHV53_10090, partial [Solirubrobacterales bacterium]|nr:hypothetical protein [Solirubrobacterales bacterium]